MSILVTGATGFIGTSLVQKLEASGRPVVCCLRGSDSLSPCKYGNSKVVRNIGRNTDWSGVLRNIHTVVHLAARVHVTVERDKKPYEAFDEVNVAGTERLARHAAEYGVQRLIYLSSIKVNGELTDGRLPFSESETPKPLDAYSLSKWNAERALMRIANETGLEIVIIRPPLVYGPGVKANFFTMMNLLNKRIPLPLGSVDNRRSIIALDNLIDFIFKCIDAPEAANQTFFVSDGEDMSTPTLLRMVGESLGRPAILFPMPVRLLKKGSEMVGKKSMCQKLCCSLQVDIEKAKTMLRWFPPKSTKEAIDIAANYFLKTLAR